MKKKLYLCSLLFITLFLVNTKVFAYTNEYGCIKIKYDDNGKPYCDNVKVLEKPGTGSITVKSKLENDKTYMYTIKNDKCDGCVASSNQSCVIALDYQQNQKVLFPLHNKCKEDAIILEYKSKNDKNQIYKWKVKVDASLPEYKKCTDEQKKKVKFSDKNAKNECYYCSGQQCIGELFIPTTTKEVAIIFAKAQNYLSVIYANGGYQTEKIDTEDKWSTNKESQTGGILKVKGQKGPGAVIFQIDPKVTEDTPISIFGFRYGNTNIAGSAIINYKLENEPDPEEGDGSEEVGVNASCTDDEIKNLKKISDVGNNLKCYKCNNYVCDQDITVGTDVDTIAIIYAKQDKKNYRVAFDNTSYFLGKNKWENVGFHSISKVYSSKDNKALLIRLTGKDGTINYNVKYDDNGLLENDAGSGKIIIGTGINPEGGQSGDKLVPGTPISGCEVIPEVVRKWIVNILKIVRYISLVLVIALGALDFMKAAAGGEPDAMKKAGQSFMKRMIAVIVLFLLPVIVDFILNMVNIYGVDPDNIDCL